MATPISNNGLTWSNTSATSTSQDTSTNWNPNLNWQNSTSDSSASQTTQTNSDGIVSNPKAELDKDAFLKLLLVELEHQDPTDPMDTDKMLTQTSQLSALEMQQNTNTTMQKMVETMQLLSNSMSTGMSISAVSAIGKMATISDNTIKLTGSDTSLNLKMYLPEASDENGVSLEVYNEKGDLVSSTKSEAREIPQGFWSIPWDGRDSAGVYVGNGTYTAKLVYNNKNGEKIETNYGTYPIQGVRFKDGQAIANLGGQEISFDKISEISDYKTTSSSSDS